MLYINFERMLSFLSIFKLYFQFLFLTILDEGLNDGDHAIN